MSLQMYNHEKSTAPVGLPPLLYPHICSTLRFAFYLTFTELNGIFNDQRKR
ncbi:Protein CBG26739 [Caenorhabditis briggsae]|uniref:Protein CBG26739 n=1 Tax=Caenorhabditis briggsae TaxID=6238 RepID=B6IEB4_CAEBR|nr:Protein CBG26739 [Caenorhabditis briggsae]CAS01178.1 Protein CBG26739 [Caenorhabditis briggsae]